MLSWIVGMFLIAAGCFGAVMVWCAAGMSDAQVNAWRDIGKPVLCCLVVALMGVAIIVFR